MDLSDYISVSAHMVGLRSHRIFKKGDTYVSVMNSDGFEKPQHFVINKGIAIVNPLKTLGSTADKTLVFFKEMFSGVPIKQIIFAYNNKLYSIPYDKFEQVKWVTSTEGITQKIYVRISTLKEFML